MITITTAEFTGGLYIRYNIPKNGKLVYEFSSARNLDEAKRMMYFRNRKYIYEKLSSWLRQRAYALVPFPDSFNYAERMSGVHSLLLELSYFEKASFWHVCTIVCRQVENFKSLAPREKSRHYNYYQREILPVLNFCIKMKGEAQ